MAESKAYRSKMMSKIRATGGKAETQLAKALWHEGVRYFKNYKKLPGSPDIAITKYKVLVFVDGEFWHGYDWENVKKKRIHTNRDYWIPKLERNMERDQEVNQKLKDMGYTVIRFWEKHEVFKDMDGCVNQVLEAIEQNKKQMEKEKQK
ncbi:very short patch repair endonuclease [Staphylococcus condimenti]|uniref:very short patch repair endonuclease n=1 Tax=Staphylococcus TaxID=1279 RepID=UPI0008A4AFC8|nr:MULTISPECIES: very short patch repair endonuclease [Staphylococcus]APR59936.1 very short patch repair endonuclease [Staphylococcus condimenti]MDK8646179.1 very short patch repair endonuclease [Staphylococcus condimenti]